MVFVIKFNKAGYKVLKVLKILNYLKLKNK